MPKGKKKTPADENDNRRGVVLACFSNCRQWGVVCQTAIGVGVIRGREEGMTRGQEEGRVPPSLLPFFPTHCPPDQEKDWQASQQRKATYPVYSGYPLYDADFAEFHGTHGERRHEQQRGNRIEKHKNPSLAQTCDWPVPGTPHSGRDVTPKAHVSPITHWQTSSIIPRQHPVCTSHRSGVFLPGGELVNPPIT